MQDMEQVREFCFFWRDKFLDPDIYYRELTGPALGDDCQNLGFRMDSGDGFEAKYPGAMGNTEAFASIIEGVGDIRLLGSAIYSQWRYFSHWSGDPRSILEEDNRTWFLLAFGQLEKLALAARRTFSGKPKELRIETYPSMFLDPTPGSEHKQVFLLKTDGTACLRCYGSMEEKPGADRILREERRTIDPAAAKEVIDTIIDSFTNTPVMELICYDCGSWHLTLTNEEGKTFVQSGPVHDDRFAPDGRSLSDVIRDAVDILDMLLFSGQYPLDIITKITMDYLRTEGEATGRRRPPASEHLEIDRNTETVELTTKYGEEGKVTHRYELPGKVARFLNERDAEDLFLPRPEPGGDEVENKLENLEYAFTVETRGDKRTVTGSFDKRHLPEDYEDFAEALSSLLGRYGGGELLDPKRYNHANRLKDEYIYCSVAFPGSSKTYYYICDSDLVEEGDEVRVPTGPENYLQDAVVKKVEYFDIYHAPYPVYKTKKFSL